MSCAVRSGWVRIVRSEVVGSGVVRSGQELSGNFVTTDKKARPRERD